MALYRCKNCSKEAAYGPMPTTSCGMLLIPAMALASASFGVAWDWWHWYSLLLPVPVFYLGIIITCWIPEEIEWICLHFNHCPKCGKRKWSQPFTRGFGL